MVLEFEKVRGIWYLKRRLTMRRRLLAYFAMLFLSSCGGGGGSGGGGTNWPSDPSGPQPSQVSMNAGAWQFQFSPGMSGVQQKGTGWIFNFPSQDGVHYLVTAAPVLTGKTLTMNGIVSGNNFTSPAGPCPCTCRGYFSQRGDTGYQNTFRWFGAAAIIPLKSAAFSITSAFTPDKWSDVNGQFGTSVPDGFAAAIANPSWMGIVCSGGQAAGHGVYSTSPASLEMDVFKVN